MQTSDKQPPISPLLAISLGLLAMSTSSILVRFAQIEAPSIVIAAYRLTLAALLLCPIAWLRHRQELMALTRREWLLALLSGFFLALHFATWITSLEYTTVASSLVLVQTNPLWVALLSPFLLGERVGKVVVIGLLVTTLGVLVLGLSDACDLSGASLACPSLGELLQGRAFFGDLLALAGGLTGAGYILIGRSLRAKMSLIAYIFVVYAMAAVVLLFFMLASAQPATGYSPQTYLWFLLLALVPQILGHSTFNWALRYFSATFVSLTLLGEPLGATILALLLFAEVLSALTLFGAILILVGIVVASQQRQIAPAGVAEGESAELDTPPA